MSQPGYRESGCLLRSSTSAVSSLKGAVVLPDQPMVSARLGSILDPEDIKEGTNVFFECSVTANPAAYSVNWLHNVSTNTAASPMFGDLRSIHWPQPPHCLPAV